MFISTILLYTIKESFVTFCYKLQLKSNQLPQEKKLIQQQMNAQFQALMKKRRKQMGLDQQQEKKPQTKQQIKNQKPVNKGFLQARKVLQAQMLKQNGPSTKQQPVKPKQQIKVNSENIKNAKALLEANLNFAGKSNNNVSNNGILPPPPSINIGILPPPPSLPNPGLLPPPPSLANLPPPPSLPNLPPPPNITNLLPPPNLNNLILPPPPKLSDPVKILPPPPSLTTNTNNPPVNTQPKQTNTINQIPILPPPPNINNLPLPNTNNNQNKPILPPPSINTTQQLPQQPKTITKTQSIVKESQLSSGSNSSQINEEQFRAFQNKVSKQKSIDKKKSIFGNEPMIRSSNKPTNQSPAHKKIQQNKSPIYQKPIVLPPNNSPYQPTNNSNNMKSSQNPKINTNLPPKPSQKKQKKPIFQKQDAISTQFFGKDIAGFLKRQFLKNNNVLAFIDKKIPLPKTGQRPVYNFPSILQDKRGDKNTSFQPFETLYVDTKNLNVSGSFLVNNLNTIKDHNESREEFAKKLKGYDIGKDPQKLNLKAIKQLVEKVPQIQFIQLNIAKISSCVRKCDSLIKQKIALKLFKQCQQIQDLRKDLLSKTEKYCKYPEQSRDEVEVIQRIMNKIRDLQVS